ncbi:hypothetical protein [Flagellimonas sediminis]|uniref:Uncharacterized protein n=1 Tax=Flagellimonas sediminis TaxID=2696468 RepID=A0A6I5KU26_9FLAO|nr:hypothetical protein [Allomuricauda sediminis]NDV44434.1 hypothetical protein [Allomuricauda sediminis]
MWFKITSFLAFLLKSTNEHRVHSPFVFNFVTKCLYNKKKYQKNKSINVLLKSIEYFEAQNAIIQDSGIRKLVTEIFPKVQFEQQILDVLFLENLSPSKFNALLTEGRFHNDTMLMIDDIYGDKKKLEGWNNLIAQSEITVSMDLYHCGILFIRREQVKEHFTIRI